MRLKLRDLTVLACAVAAGLFVATAAAASDWPTRPVRLILTLGAGSGTDIGARLLADRLSQRWGQPVVVENRPGGDGLVAINAFVSARDDHVLLFAPSSSFTAHPFLHDNLPYKPSDLVPITRVSTTLVAVSVPIGMPVASLAALVALARAEPGKLDWAGVTGAHDFVFAGWLKREGLDHDRGAVSQSGRRRQRSRREPRAGLRSGAGDRAAAARGRQDQASGHGQYDAGAEPTATFRRRRKPAIRP